MIKSFRSTEKEMLRVLIPTEVRTQFDIAASRAGVPRHEYMTRLLCNHLGLDARDFGLGRKKPRDRRREPATT